MRDVPASEPSTFQLESAAHQPKSAQVAWLRESDRSQNPLQIPSGPRSRRQTAQLTVRNYPTDRGTKIRLRPYWGTSFREYVPQCQSRYKETAVQTDMAFQGITPRNGIKVGGQN
jgi:hypothetical protein